MNRIVLLFFILYMISCNTESNQYELLKDTHSSRDYDDIDFIIISDIHYLSPSLYNKGSAFFNNVNKRKGNLTEYGDEILNVTLETVKEIKPDFLMITGDLSYEGELQSHNDLAERLNEIKNMGIPVYVIPGNHDLGNPVSSSYLGEKITKVPSITPGQFLSIYNSFGYDSDSQRDMSSLSYSVEINNDILLIGLDSSQTGLREGKIRKSTFIWLEDQLKRAELSNKLPLVFLHHSLLEHYEGQDKDKHMLLVNRKELLALLQQYHVQSVFTGHYHAQDIARIKYGDLSLYDIQTGSLFNWPFNYRRVKVSGKTMEISSHQMPLDRLSNTGKELTYSRVLDYSVNYLKKFGINHQDSLEIGKYVSDIFIRHIQGDEDNTPEPKKPEGLSFLGRMALFWGRNLYEGRLFDTDPPDNYLVIDLESGEYLSK